MQRRNWLLFAAMTSVAASALIACSGDDNADGPGTPDKDAAVDHATKDVSAADTNVPDTNSGGNQGPDGEGPDADIPDTNVADSHVADSDIGDTQIADTSTPDAHEAGPVDPCPPLANGAYYPVHTLEFSFATTKVLDGGKGQTLTINHCDFVRWHNADNVTHGVVSVSGPTTFDTGTFGAGAMTAPVQFPAPGVEDFRCSIHSSMRGELTIQ